MVLWAVPLVTGANFFFGGKLLLVLRHVAGVALPPGREWVEFGRETESFTLVAEPSVIGVGLFRVKYKRGAGAGAAKQYVCRVKMSPVVEVRVCGATSSSFQDYDLQVRLCTWVANLEQAERAAAMVLEMDSAAHRLRPVAGGDFVAKNDGVSRIAEFPRYYLAPEAVDSVYEGAARPPKIRRAGQARMGTFWKSTCYNAAPSPRCNWA